jgi:hypothetical protein
MSPVSTFRSLLQGSFLLHFWSLLDPPQASTLFGFAGFPTVVLRTSAALTSIFHPSSTFLCLPEVYLTFFDLQIDSTGLTCPSTFRCQLTIGMMANEPGEADLCSEKGKLGLDLQRNSDQEA